MGSSGIHQIRALALLSLIALLWPLLSLLTYGAEHAIFLTNVALPAAILYAGLLIVWAGLTRWLLAQPDGGIRPMRLANLPRLVRVPAVTFGLGLCSLALGLSARQVLFVQTPTLLIPIYAIIITIALIIWANDDRSYKVSFLFLLAILVYLPVTVLATGVEHVEFDGRVVTNGDDHQYQRYAVNLAHGYGYTDDIVLPLDSYGLFVTAEAEDLYAPYLAGETVAEPQPNFYRAPGWPILLSLVYRVLGSDPLVGRLLLAALSWGTAPLLLLAGYKLAGWLGSAAGGLTALTYLHHYVLRPPDALQGLMTEPAATFWVTLSTIFLILYAQHRRRRDLFAAAVVLVVLVYTRSNFVIVVPLLVVALFFMARSQAAGGSGDHDWWGIAGFIGIIAVPIALWSLYATTASGRFIAFTTQSEIAFPQFNNEDVLEGYGPDRYLQGSWQPGYTRDEDGRLGTDYRHAPGPGENGWVKGLTYWFENLEKLPALFYVKLRAGLWTHEQPGVVIQSTNIGRLHALGIAFLLILLGLRKPRGPAVRGRAVRVFRLQVALAGLLVLVWSRPLFWLVLLIYAAIALVALRRPYGDVYALRLSPLTCFVAFVASHILVILIFGGLTRFHQPLDAFLAFIGLLALFILPVILLAERTDNATIKWLSQSIRADPARETNYG